MIDLDKLESGCKKVSRDGDGKHPVIASTESIMELISRLRYAESETCALLSMLRHAEKDAARYRELRDVESETCLEFINAKARMASPEWLDGMVDEYMKCK